jgi:hypothetical protein
LAVEFDAPDFRERAGRHLTHQLAAIRLPEAPVDPFLQPVGRDPHYNLVGPAANDGDGRQQGLPIRCVELADLALDGAGIADVAAHCSEYRDSRFRAEASQFTSIIVVGLAKAAQPGKVIQS